jgi:Flp pilus assembly protein TadG
MKTQSDFDGITRPRRHAVNLAAATREPHAESRPPRRRRGALLRSGEQGQTIVEFALIVPAMLAVMTAIFSVSIAFYDQLTLTGAVNSGAQYLQTVRLTTSNPCADALTAIQGAAPSLAGAKIGLNLSIDGTAESGTSCAGATPTLLAAVNEPVTVTATYPCFLSIMSAGYGTHFISNCQLSAKATVYEY